MDSVKSWVLEVGIKKFGPSFIRGGLGALVAWLLAHQGMLQTLGVFYDSGAKIISIHLDTLSGFLDTTLLASIAGLIKVINHHADQALAAAPVPPQN